VINYYVQYLTKLILDLKAKNWDKKQIQVLQQKLDRAIKLKNKVNKDNNKSSNE
jgi:hypothetical protein